jgi:hypothetical protein
MSVPLMPRVHMPMPNSYEEGADMRSALRRLFRFFSSASGQPHARQSTVVSRKCRVLSSPSLRRCSVGGVALLLLPCLPMSYPWCWFIQPWQPRRLKVPYTHTCAHAVATTM